MEQTTEQVTEQQTTEQPAQEIQQESTEQQTSEQTEQPAWTPSYKYVFKGEEKEIDDPYFRSVIKDADSEKKFRDLYERAESMQYHRDNYANLYKEYSELAPKYQELESSLQKVASHYQNGDLDLVFNGLGIDPNHVVDWVKEKIKYAQLPDEQKAIYNESRQHKLRSMEMEEELASHRLRAQKEAVTARSFQLDNELGKADVQSVASQYDGIYGNGAFKQEVIKAGQFEWLTRQQDLTASEAVAQVLGRVKPIIERLQATGTAPVQSMPKPKVITNIPASSQSPAKNKPRSIEDLRKMQAEL
jgi:hypothetical protein